MNVGFLQFDIEFGNKTKNLETVERLIQTKHADLWVLPELFNSGYLFSSHEEVQQLAEEIPNGETTQFLISLAKVHDTTIIAGLAEKNKDDLFNSAVCVNSKGLVGIYQKVHLFNSEKKWFRPGKTNFKVFNIGEVKIGMMICFDWVFPEAARSLALLGADIICHPSNLVLPYCQNAMITRCIENRVFAITANRIGDDVNEKTKLSFTGMSQIVNPKGEVLYRAATDKEECFAIDMDPFLSRDKNITSNNHLFHDRRPLKYEIL